MKGVVFNLLEQLVARDFGEETWDALLDASGLDGVYTSLGSYPDEDLMKLVSAAADALAMPPDDVVVWFGRNALPLFATRTTPSSSSRTTRTRSFVLTLNEIIHPEVRKLYPGADVPEFDFDLSRRGSRDGLSVPAEAVLLRRGPPPRGGGPLRRAADDRAAQLHEARMTTSACSRSPSRE